LATWEDIDSFIERHPNFQLEYELLDEGGKDVMWGEQFSRRAKKAGTAGQKVANLLLIRGAPLAGAKKYINE
jgi:hypothetical protein